ncbi:hypothetical protein NOVO_02435 [Rickettsiales bacterium Ac37b]|nr:hypothetical protein NOVO_02435 [Rickettsiales bacterium Ac37b]
MLISLDKLISVLSSIKDGLDSVSHLFTDYIKGFSDTMAIPTDTFNYIHNDNASLGIDHTGEWDTNMYNMGVFSAHCFKFVDNVKNIAAKTSAAASPFAGYISLADDLLYY